MQQRHLANENGHEKHSLLVLHCTKNKRSYLLKFLTRVMVVINDLTVTPVVVLICNCDFFSLFKALINITKQKT